MTIFILPQVLSIETKAQEYSDEQHPQINQLLELSEKNRLAGDIKEATRYLNDAAIKVWEAKSYEMAITYFTRSIELNKTIKNESGIAKINSNLGMIFSDLGDYNQSLEYFKRSLDYRLKYGEKTEIISTQINIAVVLNVLQRHDDAAKYLEEALRLATEMSDAAQMKSCYGMLAETYEKAGNEELTIHYFNLYRTFHEMIQRNTVIEARKETESAKLLAMQIELEKREKELALLNTSRELEITEKENESLDSKVKNLVDTQTKQELAISLMKEQSEVSQLKIKEAESNSRIQKIWIGIILTSLGVIVIFSIMSFRDYHYRRRSANQLELQNDEIKRLNENLEDQVVARTSELQKTLTYLERRNRDLDQFSYIISHNLRGPVARIMGLGNIIDRKNYQNPMNLEILDRLVLSVKHLDSVVGDLSTILNVKDSQLPPLEMVDMDAALSKITDLLKEDIERLNAKISLKGDVKAIPAVKTYLESILYNFISNSMKFAAENVSPIITIQTGSKNGHYLLTVTDNGVGFSESDYQKIFEPYKRLTVGGSGKGLGLYMVKTQVEAMNGTIHVVSKKNTGTEFRIELPRIEV